MTRPTPSKQDHEDARAFAEELLSLTPKTTESVILMKLARCYRHNRDQLIDARVTISRKLRDRVEAAERAIEARDAQVIAAVVSLLRSEAIEADCAGFLADLIAEGRWREHMLPERVTTKSANVRELEVGDLFDYAGSFRVLQVLTKPEPEPGFSPKCGLTRLVFRVKNVSSERQHELDIRLSADLSVQVIEKMP